jgi:hypothetical protein
MATTLIPTTPTHGDSQPRKPLSNQTNIGGDMSMMFLALSRCPKMFTTANQNLVKGLNVETIVKIWFPPPNWITNLEYSSLQPANNNDNWGLFSLNLPMYNMTLDPSEWENEWFFLNGRVHPYALTWEVPPEDDLETDDDLCEYTIPVIIIRDQSYQP